MAARAARFLQELASEFKNAYSRCLQENKWTAPRPGRPGWPSGWVPDTRFQVAPDALYVPTRLVPVDRLRGPESTWHGLLARHQCVLILGAAGTGKTVLADRICYEIAAVPGSATLPYDVGFAAPLRQRSDHHQNLEMLIVTGDPLPLRLGPAAGDAQHTAPRPERGRDLRWTRRSAILQSRSGRTGHQRFLRRPSRQLK